MTEVKNEAQRIKGEIEALNSLVEGSVVSLKHNIEEIKAYELANQGARLSYEVADDNTSPGQKPRVLIRQQGCSSFIAEFDKMEQLISDASLLCDKIALL